MPFHVGHLAADAALSEEEIDNLIFAPGFSTAASVSDISGRGVGMDVVRRSIQALGGRISIASEPSSLTTRRPQPLAAWAGQQGAIAMGGAGGTMRTAGRAGSTWKVLPTVTAGGGSGAGGGAFQVGTGASGGDIGEPW